jgi:hypothetical protein
MVFGAGVIGFFLQEILTEPLAQGIIGYCLAQRKITEVLALWIFSHTLAQRIHTD